MEQMPKQIRMTAKALTTIRPGSLTILPNTADRPSTPEALMMEPVRYFTK